MRKKTIHTIFSFMLIFSLWIPTAFASSSLIGERNTIGFHYTVLQENDHFRWKITNKDSQKTIVESPNNMGILGQFREAVNDIHSTLITLIMSLIIIIIAAVICLQFFSRQKHELRNPASIIFAILFVIAIVIVFNQTHGLHLAIQEATYIFNSIPS
ncbi:hypothetical protein AB1J28_13780 [Lysinibacillus irui]|uniref:hypothetical protein n=1 Tax=Lysinibacillus irui TaxID=2998077 RepID=UPI003D2874A0